MHTNGASSAHSVHTRALTASVIVCAYTLDRWDDIVGALQSVREQAPSPHELILVVDHNDELLELARASFGGVIVVPNKYARGLSGARNSGIETSTGDICVFLDDDAAARTDWLRELLVPFAAEQVVGVGGAVEPRWPGRRPEWFPEEFQWVVGCSYRGLPVREAPIRNPIGCNMAIRRSVFTEQGGFIDGIGRIGKVPVGCEETELCIRVRQAVPQSEFRFRPTAAVDHTVPAERCTWAYFRARCLAEGRSKAQVAAAVGRTDALRSERSYATRTLPDGVARNLAVAVVRFDLLALARAGAIVAGLALTTAGYSRARYQAPHSSHDTAAAASSRADRTAA